MREFHIDPPPVPKGTPEEQLVQLYRYLFRLAEALNNADVNETK